jgi:26S proteasome regulatory subunit N10
LKLALKRRSTDQSQNGARRIIAFVGSPLQESEEELENLANKLKKNNISIDVVNFGEEKLNTKKLELFINISNGEGDEKTW